MKIRIVTMSEFHKTAPLSRFMKLRGDSRANKPIYGLFSRHYYIKSVCGKQRYNYKKETTFPHSLTKGARPVFLEETVSRIGPSLFRATTYGISLPSP